MSVEVNTEVAEAATLVAEAAELVRPARLKAVETVGTLDCNIDL